MNKPNLPRFLARLLAVLFATFLPLVGSAQYSVSKYDFAHPIKGHAQ